MLVQHLPGADLLFNHVEAGDFRVHFSKKIHKKAILASGVGRKA
jgi:hypothetical protein